MCVRAERASYLRNIQQSRVHEWEVRLERAVQLGKSASHSRITENISPLRNRWHVQTVGKRRDPVGRVGGAERRHGQHICIQTHAHLQALGRFSLPEENGGRKLGKVESRLHRNRLYPGALPRGNSVIGPSHRAVCVRVSARACASGLKTNDVASP